ncbi:sugar transferase [Geothrix alkalitolerans]|uniref:sugar transferase n=1 Tax=Geothrix alkalitolerans TaxID=2922724 RepID=UPI001FAF644A|nr:sugar transferase [Geothrix alkalitolerans]
MTRLFDFLGAILGLILLSPGLLLLAALIRLVDGPPVFYRQVRVGRKGRLFRIWKFRTMVVGADRIGRPLTVSGDPRVTRTGAWLRRWKLDELPQLINVVTGEMGFVGPRPEVPRFVALYTEAQRRVLDLRPGITDLASIAYRNESDLLEGHEDPEAHYIGTILPDKIRINLDYAAKAGVWRNLKVILATLGLLAPKRV